MLQSLLELHQQGIDAVLVTVAAGRGSIPSSPGQKLIVTRSGLHSGSVGGGKIEARAIQHAGALLLNSQSTACDLQTWNLQRDIGMTCGGEMTLLFELNRATPAWHIVIFGAGHIVQALVPILLTLPCQLTVIDTRPDWIGKLGHIVHPNLSLHLLPAHTEGLDLVTPATYVLSVTQGHSSDLPILAALLESYPALPFLGVIGSASKRTTLTRELREVGIPPHLIETIRCPLGLPIGGNNPPEIAISIAAQLLQQRPQ